MWKSEGRHFTFFILLIMGASLFLIWILNLRFEAGDVFPAYSSSRADPQGCKALFESLEALEGLNVDRNFRPLSKVKGTPETTLILLGLQPGEIQAVAHDHWVASFLENGGNLILGMKPFSSAPFMWEPVSDNESRDDEDPEEKKVQESENLKQDEPDKTGEEPVGSGSEEIITKSELLPWAFTCLFKPQDLEAEEDFKPLVSRLHAELHLPVVLPWRSGFYFSEPSDDWNLIYTNENGPVCMEYVQGGGRLVVLTDSYIFSNESLWEKKQAQLLIWMLGNQKQIVFDESHLGITSRTSISNLVFRYRFQGLVVGFLLLAVMFLWRNTSPLIPPDRTNTADAPSVGKDAASGMVNLLKRSISKEDLLKTCLSEWEKTLPAYQKGKTLHHVRRLVLEEQTRDPKQRDTVKVYSAIQQNLLNRRKQ